MKIQPYQKIEGICQKEEDFQGNFPIRIHVVLDQKNEAYFEILQNTILIDLKKIEKNQKLTGYMIGHKPMTLIYPPRYPLDILMPEQNYHTKLDVFDDKLISKDNTLQLHFTEQTKQYSLRGIQYDKKQLHGMQLLVFYTVSTRSIPAQTTPHVVVVLDA